MWRKGLKKGGEKGHADERGELKEEMGVRNGNCKDGK